MAVDQAGHKRASAAVNDVGLGGFDRLVGRLADLVTFDHYFEGVNMNSVVQWFDIGGALKMDEDATSAEMAKQLNGISGLMEKTGAQPG